MMNIMKVRANQKHFEPCLKVGMERMNSYLPLTQNKMMEAFMSEHTNPTLYAEIKGEFEAAFRASAKTNPERVN